MMSIEPNELPVLHRILLNQIPYEQDGLRTTLTSPTGNTGTRYGLEQILNRVPNSRERRDSDPPRTPKLDVTRGVDPLGKT